MPISYVRTITSSSMTKNKVENSSRHIGFGIICEDSWLYAWQKTTLEKLMSENDVELKLVVFHNNRENEIGKTGNPSWLWKYYRNRVLKKSSILKLQDSKTLFEGVHKIQSKVAESHNTKGVLEDADLQKIAEAGLDFIINFSSAEDLGRLLSIPRYGVWAYHFGNPEKHTQEAPFFWEIYHQRFISSAYLLCLSDGGIGEELLCQGHLKANSSQRKNIDNLLGECTSWPLKMCVDLRNGQIKNLGDSNHIVRRKVSIVPSNLQIVLFPIIQFKLRLKQAFKLLFYTDYWNIGVVHAPISEFLNAGKKHEVNWFPNMPKNKFMADPFGLFLEDRFHIIYEDLKFEEGIGKTASFLYKEGEYTENKIVIDEEFHMSYPFLLQHKDDIYCIPETYQAKQVRLYKSRKFPSHWELEKVLIEDYAGIDSTLFNYKGTWYLFSTDKDNGPHYNLNIHFADDLFGVWEPHPKNPVKTDIRSVRPAGTLFEEAGELFRPSMDYSEKIEGRITINKIRILSKLDFLEEVQQVLQPFQNSYFSDKTHTLSKMGQYTLVDGAKELFILGNFGAFKYKMKRVLNKLRNK